MRPRWRIQLELLWSRLFVWLAGTGREGDDRRELHDDLARLYFELAAASRKGGDQLQAENAGTYHAELAAPPKLPPAAGMAMGTEAAR